MVVPSPSWPEPLWPHASTEPSGRTASENSSPAEYRVMPLRVLTTIGVIAVPTAPTPRLFAAPQANSVPSVLSPKLLLIPPPSTMGAMLVFGAAIVVTSKEPLTLPIVSVAVVRTLFVTDEVWRMHTVWPLVIVPVAAVKEAVHPIEYCPPAMLTGAAPVSPVIVAVLEVTGALSGTLPCGMKLKGSGVVSQAVVVMLKVLADRPAMERVVVVVVPQPDDVVWRTQTVSLLLMVPGAVVNGVVQPIEYSPPAMPIAAPLAMPVTRIGLETRTLP